MSSSIVIEPGPPINVEINIPPAFEIDVQLVGGRGPGTFGMGDLDDLTTEDKTTLVAAINELNMDGVSFMALYNNAKAG